MGTWVLFICELFVLDSLFCKFKTILKQKGFVIISATKQVTNLILKEVG